MNKVVSSADRGAIPLASPVSEIGHLDVRQCLAVVLLAQRCDDAPRARQRTRELVHEGHRARGSVKVRQESFLT